MHQLHTRGEENEHRRLELGVVEHLVDELAPARFERNSRGDLVAHRDARRQTDLDRELREDALREGVEGADRGGVEVVERGSAPGADDRGRPLVVGEAPELVTDAIAQLGRGLLGERDRGDRVNRRGKIGPVGRDERDDAVDQGLGLARARAGLDEQRRVELGADCIARGFVAENTEERELIRHSSFSPSSARSSCASVWKPASSGASTLFSHSRQRSAVPMPSGSQ